MTDQIHVEVVLALPSKQELIALRVPIGSTVSDVIAASPVERRFPDVNLGELAVGIWGRIVGRDQRVCEGDRVEIYRPLQIDPREARRQLARAGRTMGQTTRVAGRSVKDPD